MAKARQHRWAAILPLVTALFSIWAAVLPAISAATSSSADNDAVLRFLNSAFPELTSYKARRHLEASTKGDSVQGELNAWTELASDGTFTFTIIDEKGSDTIRRKVLHPALVEEQRARAAHQQAESALSPANYEFTLDESNGASDFLRIGLSPRRKSRGLIEGVALVKRDDGDLVSVEGVLAKRPSFWTRRVQVTRRYARIEGVRVPIEMQSRADVLMVGRSSFSMTYDYTMINGHHVRHSTGTP